MDDNNRGHPAFERNPWSRLPEYPMPYTGPIPASYADQHEPSRTPWIAFRILGYGAFVTFGGWFLTGLTFSFGNFSVFLPPHLTGAHAALWVAECLAVATVGLSIVSAVEYWRRYPAARESYREGFRQRDAERVAEGREKYEAVARRIEEREALTSFWYDLHKYRIALSWAEHARSTRLAELETSVLKALAGHVLDTDYFGQLTSQQHALSFAPKLATLQISDLGLLHESTHETVRGLIKATPNFPEKLPPLSASLSPPSLPDSHPWKRLEKTMLRKEDTPVPYRRALPRPLPGSPIQELLVVHPFR